MSDETRVGRAALNRSAEDGRAQISFPFPIDDGARLDRFFCAEGNAELLEILQGMVAGEGPRSLYFHSREGEGRSHLLQALCHFGDSLHRRSHYLPLSQLSEFSPRGLLEGLEQVDLLCLDDLEAVAADAEWERALLHLYNRQIDAGGRLVVGAETALAASEVKLPDLRSRLGAGVVRVLQPLNDEERCALFRRRVREYGLRIDARTERFILERASRATGALLESLKRLQAMAVDRRRQLTVPFVKEACGW